MIGKVFEWFYNNRIWATSDPLQKLTSLIDPAMENVYQHEKFDPRSDPAFSHSLRQELFLYVPEGLEIIRKNGFLTVSSRAEVDLTVVHRSEKHDFTVKLGGRADFIHGSNKEDISILDGKASKHREKFVDAEQLIWYATQHYLKYHVAPVKLGFIFWCFPQDPLKWIEYDNQAIRASLDKTIEVSKKIILRQFEAKPSGECHHCDYRGKCDEGKIFLAKKKAENRIESSIFDIERV